MRARGARPLDPSASVVVPPPHGGRDTKRRREARARLAAVLWDAGGARRLPRERELVEALAACGPKDAWWVCEASSAGPVYLLPTKEWIGALAQLVDETGAKTVLEVAAGDGFLTRCLQAARPRATCIATDDQSWSRPQARMSAADRRAYRGVSFAGIPRPPHVEKRGAVAAVKRYAPDLTIVSWAPPGTLVERVLRAPSFLVLDIGTDGDVCGNGQATWRFEKEFLDGPIETRALCRLDGDPRAARATRVTLYYGRRHPRHGVTRR